MYLIYLRRLIQALQSIVTGIAPLEVRKNIIAGVDNTVLHSKGKRAIDVKLQDAGGFNKSFNWDNDPADPLNTIIIQTNEADILNAYVTITTAQ